MKRVITISPEQLQEKLKAAASGERPEEIKVTKVKMKKVTADLELERSFIITDDETGDPVQIIQPISMPGKNIAHPALFAAVALLRPHLAILSELPEAVGLSPEELLDSETALEKIFVTGFTIGGEGEAEGVTLTGYKINKRGKTQNLVTPFEKYEDSTNQYEYSVELAHIIGHCQDEAAAYFRGKIAPSAQLDIYDQLSDTDQDEDDPY
ncbi:hypothetical protein [Hufsiella ginkgonis]|uniref:Uncharacterized protein n=1 Tax=Hufsiella ginkgonis TaxID=2695274 RepID=A0A7K1Y0T9_9SPHI|nr:hypothetical protein [Hufsiella ginkgonis]MXV16860.1 hypothetical protein [Hufsiella ginkgonis]